MAQFTKKAIIDAFTELIGERPFDKITVKDIVTRCGVNRNTFYYYFEDIYALV
ncbi:MAG TPA: TetR family transcriptional regulator, partial [Ruminococcaceae bacterium]|nr:TetR family transcriptional regulator [Oscillospiraceae bacterium]